MRVLILSLLIILSLGVRAQGVPPNALETAPFKRSVMVSDDIFIYEGDTSYIYEHAKLDSLVKSTKVKSSPTISLRIENDSIRADIKKRLNAASVGGQGVFLAFTIDSTGQITGVNSILSDDFDKDENNEIQELQLLDSINRVMRLQISSGNTVKFRTGIVHVKSNSVAPLFTVFAIPRPDTAEFVFTRPTVNGRTFYAGPNATPGTMAVPTFRSIVAADVPTLNQNTTGSAATLTTGRTISITGDLSYTSPTFNGSSNITGVGTLATVNSNVGTFQNATITVNGKGLVTAASTGVLPRDSTGFVAGWGLNGTEINNIIYAEADSLDLMTKYAGTLKQDKLPSFTAGSVIFSNGTTLAQDNTNLFWDDTNKALKVKSIPITSKATYQVSIGQDAGTNDSEYSTFIGLDAGRYATNADYSTFIGPLAGTGAAGSYQSNFFGLNAGNNAVNAYYSNFFGRDAGRNSTSSYSNYFGYLSGLGATGYGNNFFGVSAGANNAGNFNNFFGYEAGTAAGGADYSNHFGFSAGYKSQGDFNDFFGANAGRNNETGNFNFSVGLNSLYSNVSGSNNVAIGQSAGYSTLGSGNLFLGFAAGYSETGSNKLYIDNSSTSSPLIGGNFDNNRLGINKATADIEKTLHVGGDVRIDGLAGTGDRMTIAKPNGDLDTAPLPLAGVTVTAPLASSGGATPNISIPPATSSVSGHLTSTDWNAFNSKINGSGNGVNERLGIWSGSSTMASNGFLFYNTARGLVAGTNENTTGSKIITGYYGSGSLTSTYYGAEYGSGAGLLGYFMDQNGSSTWRSTANFGVPRSALIASGDLKFITAEAQAVTTGDALTVQPTSKFTISNAGLVTIHGLAGATTRMATILPTGDISTAPLPTGTVTGVTASLPLSSSGGAAPNITIDTTSAKGVGTQYGLALKQDKLQQGNGIEIAGANVITNTKPFNNIRLSADNGTQFNLVDGGLLNFNATTPLTVTRTSGNYTFGIGLASSANAGALSNTDWNTFNGKIGGTGATGYIPKWGGSSSLTNSLMQENGNGIGIGGAASYYFDVLASSFGSYAQRVYNQGIGNRNGLLIQSDESNLGRKLINISSAASSNAFNVHANGMVGIGVDAPINSTMHVQSADTRVRFQSTGTNSAARFNLVTPSKNMEFGINGDGATSNWFGIFDNTNTKFPLYINSNSTAVAINWVFGKSMTKAFNINGGLQVEELVGSGTRMATLLADGSFSSAPLPTAGVGGTGTTGTIPIWSSSTEIGNSPFVYNSLIPALQIPAGNSLYFIGNSTIIDKNNEGGSAGQILSKATGGGLDWINQQSLNWGSKSGSTVPLNLGTSSADFKDGVGTSLVVGGSPTSLSVDLAGQALAVHNLASNGLITRTGSGAVSARTITQGQGILVTNGNGVAGNPTIAFNQAYDGLTNTANSITLTLDGTFRKVDFDGIVTGEFSANSSTDQIVLPANGTYEITYNGDYTLSSSSDIYFTLYAGTTSTNGTPIGLSYTGQAPPTGAKGFISKTIPISTGGSPIFLDLRYNRQTGAATSINFISHNLTVKRIR